jgi:uncharacterized coiled-coil protein SlyX
LWRLREWLDDHNVAGLTRRLDRLERRIALRGNAYADVSEQITGIAEDLEELRSEVSALDVATGAKFAPLVDRLHDLAVRADWP